ncbi:hypothetical protein BDY24DRAFT_393819 [Mrakia frigida]|uniref:uncharacterized protein n=1 Tax=Mrakia frigida TaxID=29902 RepID=UPI003FCC1620
MATASESQHGISPDFQWEEGYNTLIEQISFTNVVESEWSTLRDILKHKLHSNILHFLARPPPTLFAALTGHDNQDPPMGLEPSLFDRSPALPEDIERFAAATNGLVTAPPPPAKKEEEVDGLLDAVMSAPAVEGAVGLVKKEEEGKVELSSEEKEREEMKEVEKEIGNGLGPADVIGGRTLPNWMNESEAFFMERRLRELLDEFQNRPPFTIQRLCELLVSPDSLHSASGKYLRAIERTLLVTSSWSPPVHASDTNGFLPGSTTHRDGDSSSSSSSDGGTPRYANTPIFSPIPFLAQDEPDASGSLGTGGEIETKAILMSPLLLNSPDPSSSSSTGFSSSPFPSSSNASVPTMDLFPTSLPPTTTSSSSPTTPSVLSTSEITVDELDMGPISTSTLPPIASSSSSTNIALSPTPQPHLISPRPVALSSTTTLFPPTSPSGNSTIDLPLPSSGGLEDEGGSPPIERRVRQKVSFDDLPTAPEPRVVISPAREGEKRVTREEVEAARARAEAEEEGEAAKGDQMVGVEAEVEEAGAEPVVGKEAEVEKEEEKAEAERERRSLSPTPDPSKTVAAKEEEKMEVDIPGSAAGEAGTGGSA